MRAESESEASSQEVRKRIYMLHFANVRSGVQALPHPVTPPLARTGRAVRQECLQLFWSTQQFHITSLPAHGSKAVESSDTDKKWTKNVVRHHVPKLRNFIISCLPERHSTVAPLVEVHFDHKVRKVSAKHLGTLQADMTVPYGLRRVENAPGQASGYLRERSQMMRTEEGLVMNELLLQALVERIGAVRHGVPRPAPRSMSTIKQEVIKIEN